MRRTILFLIFICPLLNGQRANFYKESITFYLDSIHFSVEGYYWFSNNSNKLIYTNIFYPFPNFSNEKVDSISVFNISTSMFTKFNKEGEGGISFNLFIEPYDTALFRICYRQQLKSDSAIYILRTTRGWGKPLDNAEYNLIVPQSFVIKGFSYPPTKSYDIVDKKIYVWKMKNFLPIQDMIFYF